MKNLNLTFLSILCLLFSLNLSAQLEGNYWYFGNNAGLDFSSGSPVVINNGALSTIEGCSSISDASGNLLFYTDGQTVYNSTHNVMPNGLGLLGHASSSQSSLVVQKPGSTTEYYIFTVDYIDGINGIKYTKVDMSLDFGLGDVVSTEKNVHLADASAEKITAVCHGSDGGIWVIAPKKFSNTFNAWLVDGTGVNTTPVVSSTGMNIPRSWGWLKGNPSGDKLAMALRNDGSSWSTTGYIEIYDFDNITGTVTLNTSLADTDYYLAYGVEFSPSGQYLYASSLGSTTAAAFLYQFDMNNLAAAPILVGSHPASNNSNNAYVGGALQLGPDGKIYMSGGRNYNTMSTIHSPDSPGLASNFGFRDINLGTFGQLGLPSFNQCIFSTLAEDCAVITNESIICNPDGTSTYSFDFDYYGTDVADNFIVMDGSGNILANVGGITLNQGDSYGTITFTIPAGVTTFCFDLRLFGEAECCHIEHCIDVPVCNPCDSVWIESSPIQSDEGDCCHSIDVVNNLNVPYFTNITTTITTPGVTFSNPVANGGWNVSGSGNTLNWTPPSTHIPYGTNSGVMDFCLDNIIQLSQVPQTVIFDWWTTSADGETFIACSDTVYYDCTSCLFVSDEWTDCLPDGSFDYNFAIWNNSNPAHDATDLRIVPLMPGVCLDGSAVPAILPLPSSPLPSGGSDLMNVNISDCGAGLSPGDMIPLRLILLDNGVDLDWCCHVDTLWIQVPDCPQGSNCPCDQLQDNALQGFTVSDGSSCTKTITPNGLTECDEVQWIINGQFAGITNGTNPLSYTLFTGLHEVCMYVLRFSPDGNICEFEYCERVQVFCLEPQNFEDAMKDFKVVLSPNPVVNRVNMRLATDDTRIIKSTELLSMDGARLRTAQNPRSNETTFDTSDLPNGTYFIRVTFENGEVSTEKFIKIK